MSSSNKSTGIFAVLTGVAVTAAAVALVHKPTRKKVKKALMDAINKGDKALDELNNVDPKEVVESTKKKLASAKSASKKEASKALSKVQKKLEEPTKKASK